MDSPTPIDLATLNAPGRFRLEAGRPTMKAVVTLGQGGFEQLAYSDVPVPAIGPGQALLRVLAAGVNNTEINTRLGWYSGAVRAGTLDLAAESAGAPARPDGGWDAPTPFPFIQGTDCCGLVAAVGPGVDSGLVGRRALVRPCMRATDFRSPGNVWMGSDFDGAFAQFVRVPAAEVFPIESGWSDVELASLPCSYGTAENMLGRARVGSSDHVLVLGASGGVGSAAAQLALRRGARVTAVAAAAKRGQVEALGVHRALDRESDWLASLGPASVDVVVDNVAGPGFQDLLEVLRRGGRYVTSGAIAGPWVSLDKRSLYLKDLTLFGCTAWDEPVFPDLIGYVQRGEIRPLVAATYPLERIADAQRDFLRKNHVGKMVLVPPAWTGPLDSL